MRGILLDTQPGSTTPRPEAPPPDLEVATEARAVAVSVLARTLEVLDGRRPRGQLTGAVSPAVLAQITALLQHGIVAESVDCARLHRLHLQVRSPGAAEFFGTYQRGDRVRALVGTLARRPVRVSGPGGMRRTEERWVVTEFALI